MSWRAATVAAGLVQRFRALRWAGHLGRMNGAAGGWAAGSP
jgi:hypothetical protein